MIRRIAHAISANTGGQFIVCPNFLPLQIATNSLPRSPSNASKFGALP
jgi:hypothetical protein